jgi:hypothetical protein
MRVPELDWPADLFADTMPVSESRILVSASPESRSGADLPLWPAMQEVWMGSARLGESRPFRLRRHNSRLLSLCRSAMVSGSFRIGRLARFTLGR